MLEDLERPPGWWSEFGWAQRADVICSAVARSSSAIATRGQCPDRPLSVVVAAGPTAVLASLLAGYLDAAIHVTPDSLNAAALSEAHNGREVIIVALRDELNDATLLETLADLDRALTSHEPWDSITTTSLITGRNLSALSWVIAKTAGVSLAGTQPDSPLSLAQYSVGSGSIRIRECTVNPDGHLSGHVRDQESGLLESILKPTTAVAYYTHGSDACATAGFGVVLCGLHPIHDFPAASTAGVLACGRGHACPRGPHPVRLSELTCSVLMLGTCNSLRLADSLLSPVFSLPLSFLDGRGLGYVGNISGRSGGEVGTIAFLAALASGQTLSQATKLINALSFCTGLDSSTYMALGYFTIPTPRSSLIMSELQIGPNEPTDLECSSTYTSVLIKDSRAIDLAQQGRLSISLTPSTGSDEIYIFWRIESASRTMGRIPLELRIHLFRFPSPLGHVLIELYDGANLATACRESLSMLDRWKEVFRLSGLSGSHAEFCSAISDIRDRTAETLALRLPRLGFAGNCKAELMQVLASIDATAELAAEIALSSLAPFLTGPFWLTNVFMPHYRLSGVSECACPNCDLSARKKVVVHPLTSEQRATIECPRCGIVSDLPLNGPWEEITIRAPAVVPVGSILVVHVSLRTRSSYIQSTCHVAVRLSSHGRTYLSPNPEEVTGKLDGSQQAHRVVFHLPAGLMPHGYAIKLLATSAQGIAFACRQLFLVPSEGEQVRPAILDYDDYRLQDETPIGSSYGRQFRYAAGQNGSWRAQVSAR